ncbi:hypothetical protein NEUTE1DRAFT_114041 [Neurospora tetrasperma FGSC 2508]|uniref:Uncharacterized protein n=1 Tax=Neurospora tetrasperma (strain FGSC 2508 / ATCC MYA-4615 / P0657) TaxID=510951 RepID=F8MZD4_NEUT8|nr:uncharacterized protein NEUTE1DRAFT_114041 [Neurospora tetrasperma FGSC 2508]EGO52025.1 hypothetical protein NEUTE1DRAFT_114041 [Neurospora tetrasperma FGSC 2508]
MNHTPGPPEKSSPTSTPSVHLDSTHDNCPLKPKRQGDTVVRPTPQQRKAIRREGGLLFAKKYRRPTPPNSQEETATSSKEMPNYSSTPSGPKNSDSPAQTQPSADEAIIKAQLSEYSSSDSTIRRSNRHKTPSRKAAGL